MTFVRRPAIAVPCSSLAVGVAWIVWTIVAAGCAQITPVQNLQGSTKTVRQAEPVVGESRIAAVGEIIARVQSYQVRQSARVVCASADFVITDGLNSLKGKQGTRYPVRGRCQVDNIDFIAVDVPGTFNQPWQVLVDADHHPYSTVIINSYKGPNFRANPIDLRFVPEIESTVDAAVPYVNYEVVYCGVENESCVFERREVLPSDLKSTRIAGRFRFSTDASQVRLGELVIAIERADTTTIAYRVIGDDLTPLARVATTQPASKEGAKKTALGTGFIIARGGYVLTCHHIIADAKTVHVRTTTAADKPARVTASDPRNDLAVLRVEGLDDLPIAPAAVGSVKAGAEAYALGYPLQGLLLSNIRPVAGQGVVASLAGLGGDARYYQVTTPANPGNSGGPILNSRGQWIGVCSHKIADLKSLAAVGAVTQGTNFAVKSSVCFSLFETIEGLVVSPSSTDAKVLSLEQVVESCQQSVVLVSATSE